MIKKCKNGYNALLGGTRCRNRPKLQFNDYTMPRACDFKGKKVSECKRWKRGKK